MNIITHRTDSHNVEEELEKVRIRIAGEDDTDGSKTKIFKQMCEFELGKWLLVNRGLNAYWSYYLVYYDEVCGVENLHPMEKIMLLESPSLPATKERNLLDAGILQNLLKNNMTIASVPCGLMNDLLRLNLNGLKNVKLVGIDLDPKAIESAKQNAIKFNKQNCSKFICRDAWQLGIENEFDIIRSSGLSMYCPTQSDIVNLYKNLYRAIKPGGYLLTTSNMPPNDQIGNMFWKLTKEEADQIPMQMKIYYEIIKVRQGVFLTENDIINNLKKVGFTEITVSYDKRNMFLGFMAKK